MAQNAIHKKKIFHIIWITTLFFTVGSFYLIYHSLNLELTLDDMSSYENLPQILYIPKLIASSGFAILAFYALWFRINQTSLQIEKQEIQIEQTNAQNKFANYYKHLEEFEKYIESNENLYWIDDVRTLHKYIYSKAKEGIYKADENAIDNLVKFFEDTISSNKIEQQNRESLRSYSISLGTLFEENPAYLSFPILRSILAKGNGQLSERKNGVGTEDAKQIFEVIEHLMDNQLLLEVLIEIYQEIRFILLFGHEEHIFESKVQINSMQKTFLEIYKIRIDMNSLS